MTKKSACAIATLAGAALCASAAAKPWPAGAKPSKAALAKHQMGPAGADGPGVTDNFNSYAAGSLLAGQGGWQLWDGGAGASMNATITSAGCYPDCNLDGVLTVADFGCFQTKFVGGDMYADCNASGTLTVADFGCFQTTFVGGCGAANKYALAVVETDCVQMLNIAQSTNPSGKWQLKADTYIPSTMLVGQGWFILMNTATPPPVTGLWSVQVRFTTTQIISDFGAQTTAPILDQWVPIVCDIDLLADTLNITYGGTQFVTGAVYTTNVSGSGTPTIQCLDLYSTANGFRWDNVSLLPVP